MRNVLYYVPVLVLLAACSQQADNTMNGYVEGEYVYIAPTTSGILTSLAVKRGDTVAIDQELFALDDVNLKADLASAKADVLEAEATLNDLTKGQRPEEIEVIKKQKEQAVAALVNTEKEYKRAQPLAKIGGISKSKLDETKAAFDSARARVQEVSAQLATAQLGARDDKVEAAKAAVDRTAQKVVQKEKRLLEAAPKAVTAGRVEDTLYRVGEFVTAGSPVISILPPENIKIRFFVSQQKLANVQLGQKVSITCDGCKQPVSGKISFVSSQAEFTPPMIYSVGSRDKLVFMVEAVPQTSAELRPGLPVDITLGAK